MSSFFFTRARRWLLFPFGFSKKGGVLDKLTHLVTVYDPKDVSIRWVTISAFCPICGGDRGVPRLRPRRIDAIDTWIHRWDNPCGHQDTNESVLAEIEVQCAHRNCALLQSKTFYPYCGPTCAIRSAWGAVFSIRTQVRDLTEPLETLRRLTAIMSTCPFEEESEDLRQTLLEASRSIAKSQDKLTRIASEVIGEATLFGDLLDDLIDAADDDVRAENPAWISYGDWCRKQA